jgi:hypothetical protein
MFLPVPVKLGTRTEQEEDGTDDEGKPKYKSVEVDNIINNTTPIWTKAPTELKDEDYLSFYKELYPFSEDPLFLDHLNVDYPFHLTGVLYFPKLKNDFRAAAQQNKAVLPPGVYYRRSKRHCAGVPDAAARRDRFARHSAERKPVLFAGRCQCKKDQFLYFPQGGR